jgi:hypothetical protein
MGYSLVKDEKFKLSGKKALFVSKERKARPKFLFRQANI